MEMHSQSPGYAGVRNATGKFDPRMSNKFFSVKFRANFVQLRVRLIASLPAEPFIAASPVTLKIAAAVTHGRRTAR
jgi:hypothetical protein